MIYQMRTYNGLSTSKKYFLKKDELPKHLDKVVKETNLFRGKLSEEVLTEHKWQPTVQDRELESSIEILKIDPLACSDWETIFGKEQEITDPCLEKKVSK